MKVGDEIVCIRTHSQGFRNGVVKGKIFSLLAIDNCPSCGSSCFDVGVKSRVESNNRCVKCNGRYPSGGIWHIGPSLFAPIQYNSAHDELLSSITEEKSDVKIEEHEETLS